MPSTNKKRKAEADLTSQSKKKKKSKKSKKHSSKEVELLEEPDQNDLKTIKLSTAVKQQIDEALEEFVKLHDLNESETKELFERSNKGGAGAHKEIAELAGLDYWRVYHYLQRKFHGSKGKWSAEETDTLLSMYEEHGHRWALIGRALDRLPQDVWDKYRSISQHTKSGPWSAEESLNLARIINVLCPGTNQGPPLRGIFWTQVSNVMKTRNQFQCRIHWHQKLHAKLKHQAGWKAIDDIELIKLVEQEGAEVISEISWGTLHVDWSGTMLRRRFLVLVRRVPNYLNKSFSEQVYPLSLTHSHKLARALSIYALSLMYTSGI